MTSSLRIHHESLPVNARRQEWQNNSLSKSDSTGSTSSISAIVAESPNCVCGRSRPRGSILTVRSLEESLHNPGLSHSRRSRLRDSSASTLGSEDDGSFVTFDRLEIRKYPIVVGDNPAVTSGVPLTIGWDHDENSMAIVSVEEYENSRPPRRCNDELILPKSKRENMMIASGHPRSELTKAVRETIRVKNSRRRTINNLYMENYDEFVESATRKLKRFVFRKKKDSALYKQWKSERSRAEAAIQEENEAAAREEEEGENDLSCWEDVDGEAEGLIRGTALETMEVPKRRSAPARIMIQEEDSVHSARARQKSLGANAT